MSRYVYNGCMLAGWALVSLGAGMVYLPAGLITAGVLLIGMTLVSLRVVGGRA